MTTRVPSDAFKITGEKKPTVHEADNGSGVLLHREFCSDCGSGILEYGANAKGKVYLMYGTLDDKKPFPPRGEFFCSMREKWTPQVPDTFQKQKVKNEMKSVRVLQLIMGKQITE